MGSMASCTGSDRNRQFIRKKNTLVQGRWQREQDQTSVATRAPNGSFPAPTVSHTWLSQAFLVLVCP